MEQDKDFDLDSMLQGLDDDTPAPPPPRAAAPRSLDGLLRKIPVSLTLEVGRADVTLAELRDIHEGSVVELDKLAGEPLDMKVNGTLIGRAEVVVSGENYGLRVLELYDLQLDSLAS